MAKKGKKKKNAVGADGTQTLATNRRARHDYKILEEFECGIVLLGTEIKSLREGKISLTDAFATVDNGEVFLRNLHIPWARGRTIRLSAPGSCCCTVVKSTKSWAKSVMAIRP